MTKSVTNAQDLGPLANDLTRDFGDLSIEGQKAFISCPNPQVITLLIKIIMLMKCVGIGNLEVRFTVVFNYSNFTCKHSFVDNECSVLLNIIVPFNNELLSCTSSVSSLALHEWQMAIRIKSSIQQLGRSCIGLVQNAGKVQLSPSDSFAKKDLAEDSKKVVENVIFIVLFHCLINL